MILPDVNVVVYAMRPDTEHHEVARSWLEQIVNGDGRYGMAPQVLSGAIRIVTHRKLFARPDPIETAIRFCRILLEPPQCELIAPGHRHWQLFTELCEAADVRGNLVTDAWFAALAIEWGCEWVTFDRDFARFAGLKWSVPE